MSAEHFSSTREEGSPGSRPNFRSSQRKILNLLLERDNSFTSYTDIPRTPVNKFFSDSANLSTLSGSLGLLRTSGNTVSWDAQLLCSTPNVDHRYRKKETICSSSSNKENDSGNLVESEIKYLGSPITVPKLAKNLELGEDQAEQISDELMEFSLEDQEAKGSALKKTVSLCDINIIQTLGEDSNQGHLIGDFSKVCALPIVSGRHQDLKYVNPETVAALLLGKFQSLIEKFYIIDCRFPYEYLGGHIQGALNMYSQEELYNFFLKKPIVPLNTQKRIIILFHCEFSSERGPRMCRSLREEDRVLNQYPALYYPELYILKGGYRDFFLEYMELCEPQSYCPMHHQDHKAELLKCRSQTKAWKGEWQLQEQIALLVK
ncbi:M-phase inducer phosphatase 3, partial [Galemys pyrenaicus]